jgi:hypothetical protein
MATDNPIGVGDFVETDYLNALDQMMGRDITNGATGWVPSPNAWVYVSATSFKEVGVDVTDRYPVSTKLSCADSGTKYAYVISSAFETDTTVTIAGNALTGGAITNPRYSYMACAEDFPGRFAYTPTETGWAAGWTWEDGWYSINGSLCTYAFSIGGTSDATSASITLPVTAAAGRYTRAAVAGTDNGTNCFADCYVGASATSIVFGRLGGSAGWTATGTKAARGQITYPI